MIIKLTECNEITCGDGVVLNDKSSKTECEISKALRLKFPYLKDYVQPDCEEVLTFNGKFVQLECFPIENGERCDREKHLIYPLDNLSSYSERVQDACACFFTSEVKQAFIDSLPRVPEIKPLPRFIKEEAEGGEFEEKIAVKERIEGKVLHAATTRTVRYNKVFLEDPKGNPVLEDQPTGNMLIEYKGKYYPESWDGTL